MRLYGTCSFKSTPPEGLYPGLQPRREHLRPGKTPCVRVSEHPKNFSVIGTGGMLSPQLFGSSCSSSRSWIGARWRRSAPRSSGYFGALWVALLVLTLLDWCSVVELGGGARPGDGGRRPRYTMLVWYLVKLLSAQFHTNPRRIGNYFVAFLGFAFFFFLPFGFSKFLALKVGQGISFGKTEGNWLRRGGRKERFLEDGEMRHRHGRREVQHVTSRRSA